jgi:hypothetical protein
MLRAASRTMQTTLLQLQEDQADLQEQPHTCNRKRERELSGESQWAVPQLCV